MTVLFAALWAAAIAIVLIACWDVAERIAADHARRTLPETRNNQPDAVPTLRGTHNDATPAEVLAVFDELKADRYRRITTVEDDTEIVLPWLEPSVRETGRRRSWWPAPPVPGLVLVRCPGGVR